MTAEELRFQFMLHKTITLLTSGTRGDVQPYLALSLGLREAGYTVRVATHDAFIPAVIAHDLPYARLADNPSDLFARPGGADALRWSGNWIRSARATWQHWREARPMLARLLESAWHACQDSDAIIIGLPTLWGAHIAAALGVPCVRCLLQPFTPTQAFPNPLLPFTFSFGATYNRLTYHLVTQVMAQAWRGLIQRWRRELLKLPAASFESRTDSLPTLYGFSAHVVPRPTDWPANHWLTGYWFPPTPTAWQPSSALTSFLEADTRPVYIGFGSMMLAQPQAILAHITHALSQCDLRAVLAVTHNFADMPLPANVLAISDVPHTWLFPRMAAVVHHGGTGTTGAGLRAGVPTIITPYAVDQFFWGVRVFALGVGPRPLPLHALTAEQLAQALWQATHDEAMQTRTRSLAQAIHTEDGIIRACELMQQSV